MKKTAAIILAAGLSTRMKSDRQKALHLLAGQALIHHPIAAALDAGLDPVVLVVGHQAKEVQAAVMARFPGRPVRFAVQAEQRGTAHATLCARDAIQGSDAVVVINGDLPLLRPGSLSGLVAALDASGGVFALTAAELPDATGFGRLVLDAGGMPVDIVEERDATPEQRASREANVGVYAADAAMLFDALGGVGTENAKKEFYFTDVVRLLRSRGRGVGLFRLSDHSEALQVNDRAGLAAAERTIHLRKAADLMAAGVTIHQPETVMIDPDCDVGRDSEVFPCVEMHAGTRLGGGCVVGRGCVLAGVTAGEGVVIKPYSVLADSTLEDRSQAGPFTHLRPGTLIKREAKVGNFVEMKKTSLGPGSKANHLSYLGDCIIGRDVNVGAGTITCNYDGVHKLPTVIEDGAFIGSDTQLVAPVKVGQNAYVGAGTTVTKDVPAGALALSRVQQTHVIGFAERRKRKQK